MPRTSPNSKQTSQTRTPPRIHRNTDKRPTDVVNAKTDGLRLVNIWLYQMITEIKQLDDTDKTTRIQATSRELRLRVKAVNEATMSDQDLQTWLSELNTSGKKSPTRDQSTGKLQEQEEQLENLKEELRKLAAQFTTKAQTNTNNSTQQPAPSEVPASVSATTATTTTTTTNSTANDAAATGAAPVASSTDAVHPVKVDVDNEGSANSHDAAPSQEQVSDNASTTAATTTTTLSGAPVDTTSNAESPVQQPAAEEDAASKILTDAVVVNASDAPQAPVLVSASATTTITSTITDSTTTTADSVEPKSAQSASDEDATALSQAPAPSSAASTATSTTTTDTTTPSSPTTAPTLPPAATPKAAVDSDYEKALKTSKAILAAIEAKHRALTGTSIVIHTVQEKATLNKLAQAKTDLGTFITQVEALKKDPKTDQKTIDLLAQALGDTNNLLQSNKGSEYDNYLNRFKATADLLSKQTNGAMRKIGASMLALGAVAAVVAFTVFGAPIAVAVGLAALITGVGLFNRNSKEARSMHTLPETCKDVHIEDQHGTFTASITASA